MSNTKPTEQVIRAYKRRRKVKSARQVTVVAYMLAFAYLWLAVQKYPVAYYIHTHLLTQAWENFMMFSLLAAAISFSLYSGRCPVCDTGYDRRRDRPTPQDEGYCSTCRRWFNLRDYLAAKG